MPKQTAGQKTPIEKLNINLGKRRYGMNHATRYLFVHVVILPSLFVLSSRKIVDGIQKSLRLFAYGKFAVFNKETS